MKLYLMTYDGDKSSAVKLGFPLGGTPPGYIEEHNNEVIVRWGNSRTVRSTGGALDYQFVLNPRRSISLNCDKLASTRKLAEVVGTPRIYQHRIPPGVTAVVRPIEHMAGQGFQITKGPYDIPEGHYATEFIKTDMEVRVWFCGQHTMVGKRERSTDNSEHPCRSEWGYEFRTSGRTGRPIVFDPLLISETLRACKKMGLDAGAADVLYRAGECFFLELNSAPAIDHWRIQDFFQRYLPLCAKEKYNVTVTV
jgi:hypothetical protein